MVRWSGLDPQRRTTKRYTKRCDTLAAAEAFVVSKLDSARAWIAKQPAASSDCAWAPAC